MANLLLSKWCLLLLEFSMDLNSLMSSETSSPCLLSCNDTGHPSFPLECTKLIPSSVALYLPRHVHLLFFFSFSFLVSSFSSFKSQMLLRVLRSFTYLERQQSALYKALVGVSSCYYVEILGKLQLSVSGGLANIPEVLPEAMFLLPSCSDLP